MITHSSSKILVVGPAWIGDMVISQSLYKLLKQHQPEITIDVLAPAWSHPLLARMPEVERALLAPFKHGKLDIKQRMILGKQLKQQGYHQAIVLPNSFKSALIPWLANIPLRTGWLGECRWGLLNDVRRQINRLPLLVQQYASLGLEKNAALPTAIPPPALTITASAISQALQRLALGYPTCPILALCPGAEYGSAKRWPTQHYATVATQLAARGWDIWLFGSEKDQPIAAEIQKLTQYSCVDLTGKTTLGEAIDLLSLATAVVCNDSGLMHIAAALQKPLVAIYGSSSPHFTPPLTAKAKIVSLDLACSPCFKRECPLGHKKCLQDLPPSSVLTALENLLS